MHLFQILNAEFAPEVIAQYERLKPESDVPFTKYFIDETLQKMTSGKAVLFTDEHGIIYSMKDICPRNKGSYYRGLEVVCSASEIWYDKRDINATLVKEIDRRYSGLK